MSWRHKGYWYYGIEREKKEIKSFEKYIYEGDSVLEIGGHIGYVTQIFEKLVGESGKVTVCEPTPSSITILKNNILPRTKLYEIAVSARNGEGDFCLDERGGFTNSLNQKHFDERSKIFERTQARTKSGRNYIKVKIRSIDDICEEIGNIDFVKIDVEGEEYNVLAGAQKTLPNVKVLMVEVMNNQEKIFDLMKGNSFESYDSKGKRINDIKNFSGNVFFVNKGRKQ
jgi:FkbM family methyltransferase